MPERFSILTAIAVAGFLVAAALGAGLAYVLAGLALR